MLAAGGLYVGSHRVACVFPGGEEPPRCPWCGWVRAADLGSGRAARGFAMPAMKLPKPGFDAPMEFTAACWNCCMSSGFCLMMSSIPGMADLNIVFVMCSITAPPPSWKSSF